MGQNTAVVYVRNPLVSHLDLLVTLALYLRARGMSTLDVEFTTEFDPARANDIIDLEGPSELRNYRADGAGSMTEMIALRLNLASSDESNVHRAAKSDIPGLVALCDALAENHGHGVDDRGHPLPGGRLYAEVPMLDLSRNLALLPNDWRGIVAGTVRAIMIALDSERPVQSLIIQGAQEPYWETMIGRLRVEESRISAEAQSTANILYRGGGGMDCGRFPLQQVKLDGEPGETYVRPEGAFLRTDNQNVPKHLWSHMRKLGQVMRIATMLVYSPETDRLAILVNGRMDVELKPVLEALTKRFPRAKFDINKGRQTIVWDGLRSPESRPDVTGAKEALSECLIVHDVTKAQGKTQGKKKRGSWNGRRREVERDDDQNDADHPSTSESILPAAHGIFRVSLYDKFVDFLNRNPDLRK